MANRARGPVTRLFARTDGLWIRIDAGADPIPPDGYFQLQLKHPNYNALYSLALAASANRWPLLIRIEGEADISPDRAAIVNYFVVDL